MEAGARDAPVIVALHGVGANSLHWRFQFSALSDRYRVIAWNAPGYMLSDAFVKDWPDCKDYADALADFLAAISLDRVNLLGNSFGSRVAQCFAAHYPDRVIRMALTGTGIGQKSISEEQRRQVVATREAQIAKGGYGFGARVAALLGPQGAAGDRGDRSAHAACHQPARLHARRQARACRLLWPGRGRPLQVPGPADPGQRRQDQSDGSQRRTADQGAAAGAVLEVLDGYGHLPEVEAPETVNRMLREFFRE